MRRCDGSRADGHHLVTLADAAYPRALLDIHRSADRALRDRARRAAQRRVDRHRGQPQRDRRRAGATRTRSRAHLSDAGLTIVSGLALGIDAARPPRRARGPLVEHRGDGHRAPTSSIRSGNRALAHELAAKRLPGHRVRARHAAAAGNFPRRNRLISGLVARSPRGRGRRAERLAHHRAPRRASRGATYSRSRGRSTRRCRRDATC